jgi:hypothetical protein
MLAEALDRRKTRRPIKKEDPVNPKKIDST